MHFYAESPSTQAKLGKSRCGPSVYSTVGSIKGGAALPLIDRLYFLISFIDHNLSNRLWVGSGRGPYPYDDAGVKVRRVFHILRHQVIELFNGLFCNVFAWGGHVSVKGSRRDHFIVSGAVLLDQLVLLYKFEHHKPLGMGIKPLFRVA